MFRALADPTRRSLLDELFREDGQTLSALEERFSMTRFGVMKHLKQLEDAGLVVTKKRGRENGSATYELLPTIATSCDRLCMVRRGSTFTAPSVDARLHRSPFEQVGKTGGEPRCDRVCRSARWQACSRS